jgi:UDP-glucose 4-epimerase
LIFDPIENKIIGRLGQISLRILVTGGAGFIGRYLVDYLLDDHEVCIYDNFSNSSEKDIEFLIKKGAKCVNGDILDHQKLQKSSIGFDLVIHLAAKTDVADSVIHPEITNEVNVTGTDNVLKCCNENKIKKIIYSSTAAVYDESSVPISEDVKTNPMSPYGTSKHEAEQMIQKYSRDFDIDAVILRLFNVYGKEQNPQYAGVITKFLDNISKEIAIEINGDGTQTRDFVSIYDVTNAFDCAIKNITGKKGDIYNIATGNSISINELADMIQSVLGKKIEIGYKNQNENEIKYSKANISRAKKELGFVAKQKLHDGLIGLL